MLRIFRLLVKEHQRQISDYNIYRVGFHYLYFMLLIILCGWIGCKPDEKTTPHILTPTRAAVPSQEIIIWDDGNIEVSPKNAVQVGSRHTWTILFSTRKEIIKSTGSILFIVTPFWGWTVPQCDDKQYPGYTSVSCSNSNINIRAITATRNVIHISFSGSHFKPGDILTIHYGDTSDGQYPSARAAVDRYAETAPAFYFKVDPEGSGIYKLVPDSPPVQTVSLPEVILYGAAPTLVQKGKQFEIKVAAFDSLGNLNTRYSGQLTIRDRIEDISHRARIFQKDGGTVQVPFSLTTPGWHHLILVTESTGAQTPINPIICLENLPGMKLYWGDIHGHSAISDGSASPEEYFTYARDAVGLDFCALTDHDFHGFKPLVGEHWALIKKTISQFHQAKSFVIFLGYEWTSWTYGHRNVYYPTMRGDVFGFNRPESDELPELWKLIEPFGGCTIPHHVAGGPIPADWNFHRPQQEWMVEISSVHGSSESWGAPAFIYNPQQGRSVVDALLKGYRLGIMASSDSHDGHPGAHPKTGEIRGLIALRAPELTRETLWHSLQSGRYYGTSGVRIYLEFSINGHPMGSVVTKSVTEDKKIRAFAVGQQYVESMVLVKNGQIIAAAPGTDFEVTLFHRDQEPSSGEDFYYVRVIQMDGQMAWSSPIWFKQSNR
ncbi:CehA/McbA family metallohydrolase [candidate division CSSED10-310 bacterium]|uniref:CehA/McbA family metallohydrolase n=1 Tax=candidate division CSSED10-310 bacterium TaxID=2855610 RepID=A0ABV6YRI9_UNCC1